MNLTEVKKSLERQVYVLDNSNRALFAGMVFADLQGFQNQLGAVYLVRDVA